MVSIIFYLKCSFDISEKAGSTMTHCEKALDYFERKYHCSQSVLAAYASELGLTEVQALKISACFGAGMRFGEVCGACTGALMVLGALYGQTEIGDLESRQRANAAAIALLDRFRSENGSYICNALLGHDLSTEDGMAAASKEELFAKRCPAYIACSVKLLEEIILEQSL